MQMLHEMYENVRNQQQQQQTNTQTENIDRDTKTSKASRESTTNVQIFCHLVVARIALSMLSVKRFCQSHI